MKLDGIEERARTRAERRQPPEVSGKPGILTQLALLLLRGAAVLEVFAADRVDQARRAAGLATVQELALAAHAAGTPDADSNEDEKYDHHHHPGPRGSLVPAEREGEKEGERERGREGRYVGDM